MNVKAFSPKFINRYNKVKNDKTTSNTDKMRFFIEIATVKKELNRERYLNGNLMAVESYRSRNGLQLKTLIGFKDKEAFDFCKSKQSICNALTKRLDIFLLSISSEDDDIILPDPNALEKLVEGNAPISNEDINSKLLILFKKSLSEGLLDFSKLNFRSISLKDLKIQPLLSDSRIDMSGCNFNSARISNCLFLNVDMRRVDFFGAEFINVTFKNVNFNDSKLRTAQFNHCKFIDCSFNQCKISSLYLTNSSFEGQISFDESTIYNKLNLSLANFSDLNFPTG